MVDAFQTLLAATIRHLERQRENGVKYVSVAPETLAVLAAPLSRPRPARPAGQLRAAPAPAATAKATAPAPPKPPASPLPSPPPATATQAGLGLALAAGKGLDPAAKAAAIAELRARVLACQKCAHLAASRRNVVFGVGDIHSPLMFVGEAPGVDEDIQGEPFVGAAGQLLTRIIQAMGLARASVYIANILKCRPDTPAQATGNRQPTPTEMLTCLPYLQEQIDLIGPKVIVALGAVAVKGLFGRCESITRARGQWLEYRGIPVMPTFHPAYLLRNQAWSEKRKLWEDMLQVMERLGLPISQRQRNYFLRG